MAVPSSARGAAASMPAPPAPTRAEAFRYWLKLGCVSFGGPAGQIAIMHRDLVETKRWISEGRFLHALNYCMVLPGPEAQQLATYIGWLLHRSWGGVIAGALFVLPSLVVLVALSWLYLAYGNVPAVAGVLYGIKPAVVAIVLHAAWRIGSRALRHPLLWAIAAAAFVAISVFAVPFPAIVLAAGVAGALGGRWVPRAFARVSGHAAAGGRVHAAAVIDDDTPTPAHARHLARASASSSRCSSRCGCWRTARCRRSPCTTARWRPWPASSPAPRCSPSAAPTRCCPTSTRARSRPGAG